MATSFSLINIGTPNSNEGDTLRSAFIKINENFGSIDNLIEEYFDEFLSQPNQLPTDIQPITPNTNVNISSTGTGIINLTAPLVSISNDAQIGGSLNLEDNLTLGGNLIVDGDFELNGNLTLNDVNLLGAKIDCGKF